MRKILIATDGSPAALQAVELGLELAEEQHAQPIFVHVAPAADVLPVTGFAMAGPVSVPHEFAEADRSSLDEAVLIAEERGIDAQTKLLAGDPAREIVAYADQIDADLIVVGSRGLGTIGSALLGSVSHKLLHEAKRPVMVVREVAELVPVA
jgi:nucleotide-binding universal stress UspA family protein